MKRQREMLFMVGQAIIIVASINSILLCFVIANQRQDFSWYMFAMAIAALLLLWLDDEDTGRGRRRRNDYQP